MLYRNKQQQKIYYEGRYQRYMPELILKGVVALSAWHE